MKITQLRAVLAQTPVGRRVTLHTESRAFNGEWGWFGGQVGAEMVAVDDPEREVRTVLAIEDLVAISHPLPSEPEK